MGEEVPVLELNTCIDWKLLALLVKFEMHEKSPAEVSSTSLEKYLRQCLIPNKFQTPDLDRVFGTLRLGKKGEPRERVRRLFESMEEILTLHGLTTLPEKYVVKRLIRALEPKRLRTIMKTAIKAHPRGREKVDRVELYKFRDVWRLELGCDPPATVRPLRVQLIDPQVVPRAYKARPLAESQRDFVRDHVAFLMEQGIVERSRSEFGSPLLAKRRGLVNVVGGGGAPNPSLTYTLI